LLCWDASASGECKWIRVNSRFKLLLLLPSLKLNYSAQLTLGSVVNLPECLLVDAHSPIVGWSGARSHLSVVVPSSWRAVGCWSCRTLAHDNLSVCKVTRCLCWLLLLLFVWNLLLNYVLTIVLTVHRWSCLFHVFNSRFLLVTLVCHSAGHAAVADCISYLSQAIRTAALHGSLCCRKLLHGVWVSCACEFLKWRIRVRGGDHSWTVWVPAEWARLSWKCSLVLVLNLEFRTSFCLLTILRRALQPVVPETALRLLVLLVSLW
jgi:hypothetical protein